MTFDPWPVDGKFIAVDSDAPLDDVLDLVQNLSPERVIVRDAPGFLNIDDEDEDDVFYVLRSGALQGIDASPGKRIGDIVVAQKRQPATAFEPVRRRGGGMTEAFSALRLSQPAVMLTDGIPDGVITEAALADEATVEESGGTGHALGVAVDHATSVPVGDLMSLLIRLTIDLTGPDVIPFAGEVGDRIDIFVSPGSGFVVEGRREGQITVTAETDPLPIQVKLRATTVGVGSITVFAFRDGAALGSLTIRPVVVAAEAAAEAGERASAETTLDEPTPVDADLQLVILEQRDQHNQPELLFLLLGRDPELGLNLKPFGPTVLENGPGGYFTDLYRDIERLPVKTEEEKQEATERLHAIGSTLFTDLIPDDLKTLLWDLRSRVKTLWIQSAEPYVPWELCRLQGKAADGSVEEGEFFCEAFAMTRWIPGVPRRPALNLSNVAVIVPADSGLVGAQAEKAAMHKLAREGRVIADVEPKYLDVRKALASASYDGIHFSGHGKFPDNSNPAKAEIQLEGNGKLRPTDISGVATNFGRRRPLVFLNACQAGRQAPGLTGVGGWASALLRNGAAAFVGAHWEVTDDLALKFATTFYDRLDHGEPVATAAQQARIAIRDEGDPTWLAYTVFADPGVTLPR
jgi:hypothetical protein